MTGRDFSAELFGSPVGRDFSSELFGTKPTPEKQSIFREVADIPLGVGKGVVQGVRMIADAFGAGTETSKTIKSAETYLADLMSAQAKSDQQEVSRIMKDAEDKGIIDQVQAALKAFSVAPVDLLSSTLGTAAPAIVGALGAKFLGAGALVTTGVSALMGAGMGAGTIKGSIYEETKDALKKAGASEEEAEKKAQLAQEYGGKNLDQILLGTVLAGAASVGPLEKGAAGILARRILGKAAAAEGAETVATDAAKGAIRRRLEAGALEAVPELLQGGQEQVAQNIALQREGFEVPTFRGATSSGVLEGLAGAGLGAALGGAKPETPTPLAPGALPGEAPIDTAARLKAEAEAEAEAAKAAAKAAQPPAPPVVEEPPAGGEPKVRKVGEPIPLPDVLDSDTVKRIGFSRGKVHDALVGKSITDPEVRKVLEEYLSRSGNKAPSTKTAEKINAFLARLPESVAPPVEPPAPPVEPPAPPVEPPVEPPVPPAPPVEPPVEPPVPPVEPPVAPPVPPAEAAAPTAEQVSAAVQGQKEIGRGGNAVVFDLPGTPFVVRVPNGAPLPSTQDQATAANDPFEGRNFGQPVFTVGNVQILRRQEGFPAGMTNYKGLTQEQADSQYAETIKAAAAMPQSAFDQFADDLKFLNQKGAAFDPSKSNNVLIDPSSGKFNLVDINQQKTKGYDNAFGDMVITLMGNTYAWKYKGPEDLTGARKVIYEKALAAANKAGLKINDDTDSSVAYSRKLAGVPTEPPAATAPPAPPVEPPVEPPVPPAPPVEPPVEPPVPPAAPPVPPAPPVEPPATKPTAPAVAPTKPAAVPEYTEEDIDRAVATGLFTEEQAEVYRAELRDEPSTALGMAFETQFNSIKAQMDALRQNNGRAPAPKSANRKKFDELQAKLDALAPSVEGDLVARLEKMGASGVIGSKGTRPTIDLDAVRENLIKARAAPRMYEAVLNYIGVDGEGNYLPSTYSREDAAEMAGLGRSSGANVSRAAQALGITADVISGFHAGQTDIIVRGKNVSEAGTGATDLQPTRGVLYEPPKNPLSAEQQKAIAEKLKDEKLDAKERKKLQKQLDDAQPRVASFIRGAVTENGELDFGSSRVPLSSKKATGDSPAVMGLAEIYARASNYDPERGGNAEVITRLNTEIAERTKADRKAMQGALERAYRIVRMEEEAEADKADEEIDVEEAAVEEETEVGDAENRTRKLSDEADKEVIATRRGKRITGKLSFTSARKPVYPEIPEDAAKAIEDGIRGKSLIEAADYLAGIFKAGDQKIIAQRVAQRLRDMEAAGFTFSLKIVNQGTSGPANVATGVARGQSRLDYVDGKPVIVVSLRGADLDGNGINPRIMLHEFLHAATQAAIDLGSRRGAIGSNVSKLQTELRQIHTAFVRHVNAKVAESKAGKGELNEIEEAIYKREINAGIDDHELLAWGLTSPKFQEYLETIPYKGRNIWTAFVDSIRGFLGMAPRMDTALSELLHVSEQILNADPNEEIALVRRIFGPQQSVPGQVSPAITPQTEAAVQGVDVIGEKTRQTLAQRIKQDLGSNPALGARVKLTDSLASMDDLFVNAYGGNVRTATGRLNPMVLISRALDALRVSKAVQERGGLGFDSGLIVATDLQNAEGQNISYQGVMKRIADAAKAAGQTYEAYRTKIDTVLYGHREYNLREKNQTLPADEQIELLISDPAKIDELEAEFQRNDFIKGILSDLDTIRFNLIDTLVAANRISQEQAQDYKDAIGYIPFNRIGDYENAWAKTTKGANRGVAALKNLRKLQGSEERKTTSVTENFSGLVDWATKEAMKNDAGLRALKDMELMGAAFKRPTRPKDDSPGDTVTVFDNGAPVTYYVPDPAHVIVFTLADPQLSAVFKAMQRASSVLRAGVTSLPPFAIKQVFDDIVRAYTYTGVKNNAAVVKSAMLNFPKNWVNEVFKKKSASIKAVESVGLVGTFDFSQQGGNLKNILEGAGAKKEGIGSAIMRVMEAGAKASDLAVRQAIYDQVLKETNDKAEAESAAREIINFSRRGSSKFMGQMISLIPFFNAYARGMDKLATAAAGKVVGQSVGTAKSMFYKRMGVMTAMGLLYALMMQDDDHYQSLPDHVRDTNWVLPYGKELGYTPVIPVPAELAFFFKAIPERIVRYTKLYGTDEEQAALDVIGEMARRGLDVFGTPNITAQAIRPFIENISNHSYFLDRPLESQAQLKLRPFKRYGTGTSESMKYVAKKLEDAANATGIETFAISPIKLENAIRGVFGTAAGLALSVSDMAFHPGRTDRPIHQQLGPQLTGLSAVAKDPIGSRQLDAIYKFEDKVEQVNGTYNSLLKDNPEAVEQFIKDNLGMYAVRSAVKATMDNIRVLNSAAMDINQDKSISPAERRKLIDGLRLDQNEIAKEVMRLRKLARDIQAGR